MEIAELIRALEETISLLQESQSSDWAGLSVAEICAELEAEILKVTSSQPIDTKRIGFLFAPTGAIQETAIDNGWGDQYLRIASIIDQQITDG
jgi:hypothetical protein